MHILVVYQTLNDSPAEIREVHSKVEAAGLTPTPIHSSASNRSFMALSEDVPSRELTNWLTEYALTHWVVLKNDEVNGPKVLDDFGALTRSI